jgi:hypothetical protein
VLCLGEQGVCAFVQDRDDLQQQAIVSGREAAGSCRIS